MTVKPTYKPPFPWFGGKSAVADVIWAAIGADVPNYVEPCVGSGAVLFLRPGGAGPIETINDADGFVANFWRAIQRDSDAVAEHADWPVNEADLHARHLWLLGRRERITERLMGDPDYYDAKVAGWWVWGQSCWISGGWCSGNGAWQSVDGVFTKVGNAGQGVRRKLPHLGNAGQGVHRTRPHLSDAGQGVHRASQRPLHEYLTGLADRLRRVRVCCGDWSRVTGPAVTVGLGVTGVFLDPPYSAEANRDPECYAVDCLRVAHDAREWAIREGENPLMRIVLAGYEGEHDMPAGWRVHQWQTGGGYANQSKDDESNGKANRHRERLWFSPACLDVRDAQRGLFDGHEE